jgi:nucleotide-binding universal stress UspA family protein
MSSIGGSRVVVGVDGSIASVTALTWAAREAQRRHSQLLVVLAWQPVQRASYAVHADQPDPDRQRQAAGHALAAVLLAAFGADLPGNLSTELIEGMAERALVDRSAGAELLVLGSMGAPVVTGRSIGPVIRSCLSHAHCPVVVIGPEGLARDHEPGPVSEVREHGQYRRGVPVSG